MAQVREALDKHVAEEDEIREEMSELMVRWQDEVVLSQTGVKWSIPLSLLPLLAVSSLLFSAYSHSQSLFSFLSVTLGLSCCFHYDARGFSQANGVNPVFSSQPRLTTKLG